MKKANPKTSATVTPIASAAVTVEPPEGWKLNGEHGYMATDSTPAGRLVRLADVVVWLMDRRPLPCSMAVQELCTAIESAAPDALYLVQSGRFALPVTSADCFTGVPDTRSFWEGPAPAPKASECGLAGALTYMRSSWGGSAAPGEGNFCGQSLLEPLAIHLDKAAALWGYGQVAQVAAAPTSDGDEWTGERLAAEKAKFKADGKGKFMKRLAAFTGVPMREISRRIDDEGLGKSRRTAATWAPSVASSNRKK